MPRLSHWLGLAIVGLLPLGCNQSNTPTPVQQATLQNPAKGPLMVRGYIAMPGQLKIPQKTKAEPQADIYIPGVKVYLFDPVSQSPAGASTQTDLSGRFSAYADKPGVYRLCWSGTGYQDGCSDQTYTMNGVPVYADTHHILPAADFETSILISGDVKFADDTLTRWLSPHLGANVFAKVKVLGEDNTPVFKTVAVNTHGQFVLPKVPVQKKLTLVAEIEDAKVTQEVLSVATAPYPRFTLVFDNHRPKLRPLIARDSQGRRVKVATPGQTLGIVARTQDEDGDALEYYWDIQPTAGNLNVTAPGKLEWKVPNAPGQYPLRLTVGDKNGGYATEALWMRVADKVTIGFSGRVDSPSGAAVSGALVEIVGQKPGNNNFNRRVVQTDANGFFSVDVADSERFVMNIRKPGYGLMSQVYQRSIEGGRWTLYPAQVMTDIDPTKPIVIEHKRDPRDCSGPPSTRTNWSRYPDLAKPQWQDGKGNVIAPPSKQKLGVTPPGLLALKTPEGETRSKYPCNRGIKVEIPANALLDKNGNPPPGKVTVALTTIDLNSPMQMPGDNSATSMGGSAVYMESWGAGTIDIYDANREYSQIAPGKTARVTIPIDRAQLEAGFNPDPTIPMLTYDEDAGIWREDGKGVLQGDVYVAKRTHFSPINADKLKVEPACVRIVSPTLPPTFPLEFHIPNANGAPTIRVETFSSAAPADNMIINLPTNTNIVLVPLAPAGPDANFNYGPFEALGTFVVNTGPKHAGNAPATDSAQCATEVVLGNLAVPDDPGNPYEFLHGLSTFAATNLDELDGSDPQDAATLAAFDQATLNYYNQADPSGCRSNFADFRKVNGFTDAQGNEQLPISHASYANSVDLGFGRDMYCKENGQNVACYVSNYGNETENDEGNANDSAEAHAGINPNPQPFATVAMEYSPIEDAPGAPVADCANPNFSFADANNRVVKFYVFNADGSARLNNANLDNKGARPIPQLCMVCHGGDYPNDPGGSNLGVPTFNNASDVDLGSAFLPFDSHTYTLPTVPGYSALDQKQGFIDLNNAVLATNPPVAIQEVIAGLNTVPPGAGPDFVQNDSFVVPGWSPPADAAPVRTAKETMYQSVVAKTCRVCHIAITYQGDTLSFRTADDINDRLAQVENRVCDDHVMPHSFRTHQLFWTSSSYSLEGPPSKVIGHLPGHLQLYGDAMDSAGEAIGWNGEKCGDFTGAGQTPQTFFETDVFPVFDQYCDSCHFAGSNFTNTPLDLNTPQAAYQDLVDIASEQSALDRVDGNGAINGAQRIINSYLVHKLEGSHLNPPANGSGSQMPLGGPDLSGGAEVQAIRDWISIHGAQP